MAKVKLNLTADELSALIDKFRGQELGDDGKAYDTFRPEDFAYALLEHVHVDASPLLRAMNNGLDEVRNAERLTRENVEIFSNPEHHNHELLQERYRGMSDAYQFARGCVARHVMQELSNAKHYHIVED